ncbi:sugar transferase [Nitratifractor sp.]|uniref:sugar transferase n=1 Tax=Nitratifractor sp. TaxID=2268144 RepID=UPI0025F6F271|nr:sugar transferase [Nitratifractor sp.]
MRVAQLREKRLFDLLGASLLLVPALLPIAIAYLVARIETGESGFFLQERIGKDGKPFRMIKIRTMKTVPAGGSTVTTARDPRITRSGRLLRRWKIDELPQLFNVVKGEMSLVGPRPDVPGFADRLEGEDRIVLSVPPGITGPASLAFRDEEELLAGVEDPERYNREVIWPQKVRINREYLENWSLRRDIEILWKTLKG